MSIQGWYMHNYCYSYMLLNNICYPLANPYLSGLGNYLHTVIDTDVAQRLVNLFDSHDLDDSSISIFNCSYIHRRSRELLHPSNTNKLPLTSPATFQPTTSDESQNLSITKRHHV